MSKTDLQLKQDVEEELRWDPKINAARIGVAVENGAVSLTGVIDTYPEKWGAEDAAKRVAGVRSVAQDLTVKILGEHRHSDAEIAEAALNAIKWDVWIPNTVKLSVQQGWITLEGKVAWNFQRDEAESAVRHLTGVMSVVNNITLKPTVSAAQVKDSVKVALQRQATVDADTIRVETAGSTVTLSGEASTWQAVQDASDAAWAAPGVTDVVDNIRVMAY